MIAEAPPPPLQIDAHPMDASDDDGAGRHGIVTEVIYCVRANETMTVLVDMVSLRSYLPWQRQNTTSQ